VGARLLTGGLCSLIPLRTAPDTTRDTTMNMPFIFCQYKLDGNTISLFKEIV